MRLALNKKAAGVLVAGLSVTAVVGGSGIALAGPGFGNNNIHGCIGQDGKLRIAQTCRKGELNIDWQARGKDAKPGKDGAKGATGATGPAGLPGPKGDTGATGAAGPAGATGATGATGAAGSAGPAGPKGDTGATGAAGATGPAGAAGTAGRDGLAGLGLTYRGTWREDASYAVNDIVTHEGSSYVALNPVVPQESNILTRLIASNDPTDSDDWALIAERGNEGVQGIQGVPGVQGPRGDAGVVGPAGPQGDAGLVGPAGPQGPIGQTGPAGPAGPAGAAGSAGPAGPTGPQGPEGNDGIGSFHTVTQVFSGLDGTVSDLTAPCGNGETVIGGGFGLTSPNSYLSASYPHPSGTAWVVDAWIEVGTDVTVYAICATTGIPGEV